jgi:hypothetical protein
MFSILSAIAIALYWFLALRSDLMHQSSEILYAPPDAQSYLAVAEWIRGKVSDVPPATIVRPLGYPAFLAMIRSVSATPMAVVIAQFLLWLASINLIAAAAWRFTGRCVWGYIAGVIMMTDISLILISWRALTETCAVFALSAWVYCIARIDFAKARGWRIFAALLLIAVATVIRPLFFMPFVAMAVAAVVMFWRREGAVAWIFAASMPVAAQMAFMMSVHHLPTVSIIGKVTLRSYYLSQLAGKAGIVDREGVRSALTADQPVSTVKTIRFLARNPIIAARCYYDNLLHGNLLQSASDAPEFSRRALVIETLNRAYVQLHVMLLPMVLLVLVAFRDQTAAKAAATYLLFAFVIASCGISFWQGDRLTLTALPLWIPIYAAVISRMAALFAPIFHGRNAA